MMTPRVDVIALTIPVREEDVARAVRESGHGAFPVVHDDLDDLVGVLFVTDLFRSRRPALPGAARTSGTGRGGATGAEAGGAGAAGEPWREPPAGPTSLEISRRVRQPYVVPETTHVLDALAGMRRQRRGFAVVVDEYGGVAGVLTVKDLIEPLVGELHDEFDPANEEPSIVRVDGSRWLVDGKASVDDVRERLGVEVPDGEYVTLAGFLLDELGHIPAEGESLRFGDWELRVVEMDKRRIARVVAERTPGREPAAEVEREGGRTAGSGPSTAGDAVETGAGEGPGGGGPAGGSTEQASPEVTPSRVPRGRG